MVGHISILRFNVKRKKFFSGFSKKVLLSRLLYYRLLLLLDIIHILLFIFSDSLYILISNLRFFLERWDIFTLHTASRLVNLIWNFSFCDSILTDFSFVLCCLFTQYPLHNISNAGEFRVIIVISLFRKLHSPLLCFHLTQWSVFELG